MSLSDEYSTLGQVWTPIGIANDMVEKIRPFCDKDSKILDPSSGPFTFFSAALKAQLNFKTFTSYEIDTDLIANPVLEDSLGDPRHVVVQGDAVQLAGTDELFDAAILNPPYVRHEQISARKKLEWQGALASLGYPVLNRRMNLYGYFILLTASKLKIDGVMCGIIYDSLSYTEYGKQTRSYLESNGKFISRETFSTPFAGRLIDAEIFVWQKSNQSIATESVHLGTREVPKGYCRISDLAEVWRGTGFPNRKQFVTKELPNDSKAIPILTKQPPDKGLIAQPNAYVRVTPVARMTAVVEQGESGDTGFSKSRLRTGIILFNYYFRERPRHLLNSTLHFVSDNFYCITPRLPAWNLVLWLVMNSDQVQESLIEQSRTQGSGLRKLQLFEYKDVLVPDLRQLSQDKIDYLRQAGERILSQSVDFAEANITATLALNSVGFGEKRKNAFEFTDI